MWDEGEEPELEETVENFPTNTVLSRPALSEQNSMS